MCGLAVARCTIPGDLQQPTAAMVSLQFACCDAVQGQLGGMAAVSDSSIIVHINNRSRTPAAGRREAGLPLAAAEEQDNKRRLK